MVELDMGAVDEDWEFCDLETNNGFQLLEKPNVTNATENIKDIHKQNLLPIGSVNSEKIKMEDVSNVKLETKNGLKFETKPVSCSECNQMFRKQRYLNSHMREVHDRLAELSTCEICLKQFKYFHLNKHIQNVHTKEDSHCDECGKVYSNRKHFICNA